MKVLLYAYKLVVSGPSVNAIELAAALRDLHGFDITFFATPGPMLSMVNNKQLHFIAAPDTHLFPSRSRISALRQVVQSENPDLLYVWDGPQSIDAFYGVHLPMRIPMAITDMTMDVTRYLPKSVPITFGTPELVDEARVKGRTRVELLLPPVDTCFNSPGAVDPCSFRREHGVQDDDILVVTVSRVDRDMKGDSLIRSVEAVRRLGREFPLRFMIVGDGDFRPALENMARSINSELGRTAVTLPGAMVDPRPAYAAADIIVGMGTSALRGMAFAKPVIVVGRAGFAAPLTRETASDFYRKGIYGVANGRPGIEDLSTHLRALIGHSTLRHDLGMFSREFVVRHFSLEAVSAVLADFCRMSVASRVPPLRTTAADGLRTAAVYLKERRFLMSI